MFIPILYHHDQQHCVGCITVSEDEAIFEFNEPQLKDNLFSILGNCGIEILESEIDKNNKVLIKKGRIFYYSIPENIE